MSPIFWGFHWMIITHCDSSNFSPFTHVTTFSRNDKPISVLFPNRIQELVVLCLFFYRYRCVRDKGIQFLFLKAILDLHSWVEVKPLGKQGEKFLSGHIGTALLNISGFVVPMYKFEVLRISERKRSQQDGEAASWMLRFFFRKGGRGLEILYSIHDTSTPPSIPAVLRPTTSTVHQTYISSCRLFVYSVYLKKKSFL